MAQRQWTPQQKQAIDARGGSVLVSAAAGSGKTAVLVERIMGRLQDTVHPMRADRMLVVTFSNAAALEMKQRLMRALDEALAVAPEDAHLQKQRRLVERAQICTIHAFCFDLLRENFHKLGLSPNTRAGDEKELQLLRQECMEQAVEEQYLQGSDFYTLIELLSTGRDDSRVFDTLRALYDFVRAHPFYNAWLDKKLELYDDTIPVAQTAWGKAVLRQVEETLVHCTKMIRRALEMIVRDDALSSAYFAAFSSDVMKFEAIVELCRAGKWDGVCEALKELKRDRLGRLKAGVSSDAEQVKEIREKVYTRIIPALYKGTTAKEGLVCATESEFAEDIAFLRPLVAQLFSLLRRFDALFTQSKHRRMLVDFSDMEQMAAELLASPNPDGGWTRSALAAAAGSAYDEILIDEFQDTNEVQEMIFRALSCEETNLFMVGDVKQSIYRFRQACPRLFIEKKERYAPYDGVTYPSKIILGKNFRSAPEITGAINLFFSLLMSKSFGEIDYNEEEALNPGLPYPPGIPRGCTLRVMDLAGDTTDKAVLEATDVARQIRAMVDSGFLVTQGEDLRPVRYSDICILMRSVKRAKVFREALQLEGVPAWAEPKNGFLRSKEIAPLVCLMRVLSNPLSDIDLVSVMLSPLYGFCADDLAVLRTRGKKSVYRLVCEAAEEGRVRFQRFLQSLEGLRRFAARSTADQLLRRVFDETNYLNKILVMPGGGARRTNLLLLVEYARGYRTSCVGVFAFAAFLNRLLASGEDLAPAGGCSEQADVVRIMTIHRSKGLEFPVVFLCESAREFNKSDYAGGILWNSEMGFACARRDFEQRKQFQTVPLQALRQEQKKATLAEELRMLYVAMTRAREQLIITGVCNRFDESLAGWICLPEAGKLSAYELRSAKSYLDWLMMVAVCHPSMRVRLAENGLEALAEVQGPLEFVCVSPPKRDVPVCVEAVSAPPAPELQERLQAALSFRYPFEQQTSIPGKLAASQLGAGETGKAFRFRSRPQFLTGEGLSGAQKGNALHKFMQFAQYEAAAKSPQEELARLERLGFLSGVEARAVSTKKLERFFASALAARIFASEKVLREMRFLAEVGREEVGDFIDLPDEQSKVVVQGIADCVFFEDGGAVIVDYKTDGVRGEEELIERYAGQMEIYRRVLGESLGARVQACILYSFALDKEILVPPYRRDFA